VHTSIVLPPLTFSFFFLFFCFGINLFSPSRFVSKGEFASVQDAWLQFWGVVAQHFRPGLATAAGRAHVERCDAIFFRALLSLLITDVLAGLAADLTKDLRYLAKCLEPWLKVRT
jgi:hypothetical protein